MIKTIDFNTLNAGTIVHGQYTGEGVTISAIGGSGDAMIFDSANPTGGDTDLATTNLGGVLIISEDGDTSDPDDNACGGTLVFDFTNDVRVKSLTFLDIEETARMVFYDADGAVISNQFVEATEDGEQHTVGLNVEGVARMEVILNGSGAIDNLIYDDPAVLPPAGDGIVSGAAGDDLIDLAYTGDPDGDRIDAGDAIIAGEAADDDIVDAGAGNDTVMALEGDDDVYAGSGDDVVDGGAGNDIIYGDSNLAGGSNDTETVRESFEWDLAGVSDAGRLEGFTQDTGNANVTFSILSESDRIQTEFSTDDQLVDGIEGDGAATNGNSSLDSESRGEGQSAGYELGFDTPVTNVDFRINDIDGDGVVRVLAYDAAGNLIDLDLEGGSGLRLIDTDGVFGADTADSLGGYQPDTSATYSLLVNIPGPVSRIVVVHSQDGSQDTGINVTDVYFDVISGDNGVAGNDDLSGGDGDDSIFGEGGDDTLTGGAGNDTVFGGTGNDVIDTSNGEIAPDLGYPGLFSPDSDPENDRDSVDGGDGDDTITTGDDRDTVTGGEGDDVINAGIDDDIVAGNDGDDRIVGGEGNDDILGGDGNDTIYAGNDPDVIPDGLDIEDDGSNPFGPDLRPDNGRDTVDGGAGDDVIYGADDDDLLMGGDGNDYLDGQIDDDTLQGGLGLDTLIGGQGDDSLEGGLGDDSLEGGIGDDTLRGNRDDDTLMGGDGDDLLDGGGQNDLLIGGAGNDTMFGGNDRDTFVDVNAGDVVNGNEGGDDFDTLDLTGSAPEGGRLEVEYDPDNAENGTVFYYDADNNAVGELEFSNIENVIPCFTPGTLIATPKGERRVETLQVGDRIITRDNGIQQVRWVGAREMTGEELASAAHLRPVLIRKGALGNDLPERDMMVSPNHRVLVANDKTALYFEEREVLVAAKHLTGLDGVDIVDVSGTTYIHIMFDQHEVMLSDGTWTESFQPGDMSLAGIGNAQRQEILEIFPELATRAGIDGYTAARKSLKRHEAKLVLKN